MVDGSPGGAGPELSVIVPCWNAAGSIERALGSVLADRETSLECVAVDDGSSDGSPAILERLAAADPRVVVDPCTRERGRLGGAQPGPRAVPRDLAHVPRRRRRPHRGRRRRPDAPDADDRCARRDRPADLGRRDEDLGQQLLRHPRHPGARPEVHRRRRPGSCTTRRRRARRSIARSWATCGSRAACWATSRGRCGPCCGPATGSR